jgi:hypothetical protein
LAGGIALHAHVDVFAPFEEDNEAEQHSPVVLYEDGKPLGPAHSLLVDIARKGGRYTHLKGVGIVFSSSDNRTRQTVGTTGFHLIRSAHAVTDPDLRQYISVLLHIVFDLLPKLPHANAKILSVRKIIP